MKHLILLFICLLPYLARATPPPSYTSQGCIPKIGFPNGYSVWCHRDGSTRGIRFFRDRLAQGKEVFFFSKMHGGGLYTETLWASYERVSVTEYFPNGVRYYSLKPNQSAGTVDLLFGSWGFVANEIIGQSLSGYPGNCACPDDRDSRGYRCGRRSAYSREGGYSPLCYPEDVTVGQVLLHGKGILQRWGYEHLILNVDCLEGYIGYGGICFTPSRPSIQKVEESPEVLEAVSPKEEEPLVKKVKGRGTLYMGMLLAFLIVVLHY